MGRTIGLIVKAGGMMSSTFSDLSAQASDAWGKGNLPEAFELLQVGAKKGDEGCLFDLAYFYDNGIHVRQDLESALRLYRRIYRMRSVCAASAANNIAVIYKQQGKRQPMFAWYRRAFSLGDGDAAVALAECWLNGVGVRKSKAKAIEMLLSSVKSSSITEDGRERATMLLKKEIHT
jgi:TPR repeat protein